MAMPDAGPAGQPEPPQGNRFEITFEASGVVGPPAENESTGDQE